MNKLNNILVLCPGSPLYFAVRRWRVCPKYQASEAAGGLAWACRHPPVAPAVAGGDSERSIKVDQGLNLKLCVTQGSVKINGWNRNELRVFVQDGRNSDLKCCRPIHALRTRSGYPSFRIEGKSKFPSQTDCISGGEIEIDVPYKFDSQFQRRRNNDHDRHAS